MAANRKIVLIYKRKDGKWAWHLKVGSNIIATDGGQGYENESDCQEMAEAIVGGEYSDAEFYRYDVPSDGRTVRIVG